MTAPVSLGELKAGIAFTLARCQWCDEPGTTNCPGCKMMRRLLPLVELAEAYLAVRDLDKRPKGMGFGGFEAAQAHERLALAAKQVRP